MAALLAGARLVLRQGVRRLLPPGAALRLPALPARCVSSSARLHTTRAVQEEGPADPFPVRSVDHTRSVPGGWSLHQLGVSMKKSGRVSTDRFLKTYEDFCKAGKPSDSQAWFMLQMCGSALPQMPPAERTTLASKIWNKLQEMGVEFNARHYNALLKVYLENGHKFSPTEFLAGMEAAQVPPDQNTYEELIAVYCNEGDIEGASTILGFMKSKNFPITENVFNSLITGHARTGDMESAENILSVMQGAGLKPGRNTLLTLACAVAEKGDAENLKKILGSYSSMLRDKELLKVISTLVKAGHTPLVPEVFEFMQTCTGYIKELINLCLELLTQGHGDAALMVVKRFRPARRQETEFYLEPGNFILCQCVNLNMPIEDLKKYATELVEANFHHSPLQFALFYALTRGNEDMAWKLMGALKEEGLPIQQHYFWPLLAAKENEKNLKGFFQTLQAFHRMGVELDLDTFRVFVLDVFKDADAAMAALQESGFEKEFNQLYLNALKNGLFSGFYKRVCSLLSSNIPFEKNKGFINGVQSALLRCNDPETMAKITKLLYPDGSGKLSASPETDSVGYFLYGMIDGLSDSEAQAKEERLKQYFHQLKEMGFSLRTKKAQDITELLDAWNVPQLQKAVKSLVSTVQKVDEAAILELEEELQKRKANSEPYMNVLRNLLEAFTYTRNLEKIAELKSNYADDLTFGMYMTLLRFYTYNEKPQEALKVKEELKEFPDLPSAQCYFELLKLLVTNDMIEDAINVLKEMQERDVPIGNSSTGAFFYMLDTLAEKGDLDGLNRFHENLVMLGLAKPTSNLCSPLVSVHLKRNDLPAALDAMLKCVEKYKCAPLEHDVMMSLIEAGDSDLLKKAVDHLSYSLGEAPMLHSLLFAFIELGMYEEAQEVAETPGLRANLPRMHWFMRRCQNLNKGELLEKLLELTKSIFGSDQKEMYIQLINLYENNEEQRKADVLRQKMEEESINLQNKTRPNDSSTTDRSPNLKRLRRGVQDKANDLSRKVEDLCKNGNFNEAYSLVLQPENDVALTRTAYNTLIAGLLEAGLQDDAVIVENFAKNHFSDYSMKNISCNLLLAEQVRRDCLKEALVTAEEILKRGSLPSRPVLNKLTEALALAGDVESLQKLTELSLRFGSRYFSSKNRHYFNVLLLAHFRNGNFEEATSMIESQYTDADLLDNSVDYTIRRLIDNDMSEALEKVSIVAEKLANQFSVYRPVTDLFLRYVQSGREEEARQLLQRCNSIMEQRGLIRQKMFWLLKNKQEEIVSSLVDLLPDPFYKQAEYNYQLRLYANADEYDKAMAVYEKMQFEQIQPEDSSLRALAHLLRRSGKPVPFTEPPPRGSEQSSDDGEELSNAFSPPEDKH